MNTVPEYFGKRFSSKRLRMLSSVTLVFAVTAYMLSAMQGISTLMNSITGLDYKVCVIIAWLSFTIFTVYSGSKGVLLTDTIMFMIFLAAALVGIPYIVHAAGGWNVAITALAQSTTRPGIISWHNNLNYLYPTGTQNLIWAIVYGIVWAIVVMVSPWQTSRYLMAKDEHTVQRSSIWASMGVVTVTMALYFSTAFIYKINPNIEEASKSVIWGAMNLMPMLIGVLMLTGILSAGVSSASTFLSLIGSSLTNDILANRRTDDIKENLKISRIGMASVSIIQSISRYCVPFFFMVSGYFCYCEDKTVDYSRKLRHIGVITISATCFYGLISLIGGGTKVSVRGIILWLMFNQPSIISGQMWFLFALLYDYIVFAMIDYFCWHKVIPFIAALGIVAYILLAQGAHIAGVRVPNMIYRNFLVEGLTFMSLGYWIHECKKSIHVSDKILILVFILTTLLCPLERFIMRRDFGVNIMSFPQVISLFLLCSNNPELFKNSKITVLGNKYSLYVYILHPAIWHGLEKIYDILKIDSNRIAMYIMPLLCVSLAVMASIVVDAINKSISKKA